MLKILKSILPVNLVEYLKIRRHEKFVLASNFEDHLLKQKTIQDYAQKNNLDVFIETGTYIGRMVNAQLPFFKKIISIEISEQLYKYNKRKFKREQKVTLLLGDSGEILKDVTAKLIEPALFWLDGHFSGGLTNKGLLDTPIAEELDCIFKNPFNHCILIDDARLFNGTDDYPDYESLRSFVLSNKIHASIAIENDIIVINYVQ